MIPDAQRVLSIPCRCFQPGRYGRSVVCAVFLVFSTSEPTQPVILRTHTCEGSIETIPRYQNVGHNMKELTHRRQGNRPPKKVVRGGPGILDFRTWRTLLSVYASKTLHSPFNSSGAPLSPQKTSFAARQGKRRAFHCVWFEQVTRCASTFTRPGREHSLFSPVPSATPVCHTWTQTASANTTQHTVRVAAPTLIRRVRAMHKF